MEKQQAALKKTVVRGASPNPQAMLLAGMTNLGLGNLDQAETQLAQASAPP